MKNQTLQTLYLSLEHLNHWTKLTQKTTLKLIRQAKLKFHQGPKPTNPKRKEPDEPETNNPTMP